MITYFEKQEVEPNKVKVTVKYFDYGRTAIFSFKLSDGQTHNLKVENYEYLEFSLDLCKKTYLGDMSIESGRNIWNFIKDYINSTEVN